MEKAEKVVCVCVCLCVYVCVSHSVMSNSLQPHELDKLEPARLLYPWDSPGLPFSSPEGLPDPGIEPGPPALQADSLASEPPRWALNRHGQVSRIPQITH